MHAGCGYYQGPSPRTVFVPLRWVICGCEKCHTPDDGDRCKLMLSQELCEENLRRQVGLVAVGLGAGTPSQNLFPAVQTERKTDKLRRCIDLAYSNSHAHSDRRKQYSDQTSQF